MDNLNAEPKLVLHGKILIEYLEYLKKWNTSQPPLREIIAQTDKRPAIDHRKFY